LLLLLLLLLISLSISFLMMVQIDPSFLIFQRVLIIIIRREDRVRKSKQIVRRRSGSGIEEEVRIIIHGPHQVLSESVDLVVEPKDVVVVDDHWLISVEFGFLGEEEHEAVGKESARKSWVGEKILVDPLEDKVEGLLISQFGDLGFQNDIRKHLDRQVGALGPVEARVDDEHFVSWAFVLDHEISLVILKDLKHILQNNNVIVHQEDINAKTEEIRDDQGLDVHDLLVISLYKVLDLRSG
jgi:hypothetical protein